MTFLSPDWELPPNEFTFVPDATHLWAANLDGAVNSLNYWEKILSPDERERAERLISEQYKNRFVAGRGILRSLLGKYLRMQPERIQFRYNQWGKPMLDVSNILHFNLSHSNGVALFAFAKTGEIGVDIEFISPETNIEQTAALVFSKNELALLQSAPPDLRRSIFFKYWTRKEAFMKASGEGFSVAPNGFDVSFAPEKPVANIGLDNEVSNFSEWFIQDLPFLKEYTAAVAHKSRTSPLSFFKMPDSYFF